MYDITAPHPMHTSDDHTKIICLDGQEAIRLVSDGWTIADAAASAGVTVEYLNWAIGTQCPWCLNPDSDREPIDDSELCEMHRDELNGVSRWAYDRMISEQAKDRL